MAEPNIQIEAPSEVKSEFKALLDIQNEYQKLINSGIGDIKAYQKALDAVTAKIKSFRTANVNCTKSLDKLAKEQDQATQSLSRYGEMIGKVNAALSRQNKSQNSASVEIRKAMSSIGRMGNTVEGLEKSLDRAKKAIERNQGALGNETKELKEVVTQMEKALKVGKTLNNIKKEEELWNLRVAKATATNANSYRKLQKNMKGIGSDVSKLGGFFGGTTMSLGNAKDAVIKYNQTMFDLKRTYASFGKDTKDLTNAFDQVSKSTTFSKQQFAEFANTMASGYSAINPTVTEVANFAEMLQNQFGPNVEVAIEKSKELLGMFEKFPPAQRAMLEMSKLLKEAEGKGADSNEVKLLNQRKATLASIVALQTGSVEQANTVLKLGTAANEKEKELLGLNKANEAVKQKTADATLALGQAMEPSLKMIAESLSKVMGFAEMLPTALLVGVGVFQTMGAVMNSSILGNMKIAKTKTEVWFNGIGQVNTELGNTEAQLKNIIRLENEAASGARGVGSKTKNRVDSRAASASRALPSNVTKLGDRNVSSKQSFLEKQKAHLQQARLKNESAASKMRGAEAAANSSRINAGNQKSARQIRRENSQAASAERKANRASRGGGMAGKAMGVAATGAVAFGAYKMSKMSTVSKSKKDGFSDTEASSRGTKAGVATAAGTIIGGLAGTLAGPVGTMIGMQLGTIVGGAIGDLWNEGDKPNEKAKETTKLNAGGAVGKQDKAVGELLKKWLEVQTTYEANTKMLQAQTEALKGQADILNDLFVMSAGEAREAYSQVYKTISNNLAEVQKQMDTLGTTGVEALQKSGIEIAIDADDSTVEMVEKVQDAINGLSTEISLGLDNKKALAAAGATQKELDAQQSKVDDLDVKRKTATLFQDKLLEAQNNKYKLMQASAKGLQDTVMGNLKPNLEINSLIESRLDTERALMEAANFGMGASVKMMQKQVDLSYENIQVIQETLKVQDEKVASEMTENGVLKGLTGKRKEEAAAIIKNTLNNAKNADSSAEMTENIEAGLVKLKEQGASAEQLQNVRAGLNESVKTYSKLQNDSLKAQKKIYDLTKDVREGYLDAIREMSFGAGEFEKIIGTQDMGVTQLMESVKGVTGEDKLNSMALGGITATGGAGGQARQGNLAKYTTGGLDFGQISGKAQETMNKDIYGYADSMDKVKAEGKGTASGPTAGAIGSNKEHSDTMAAMRESDENRQDDMAKGVEIGLKRAGVSGTPFLRGVNQGVQNGNAPGQEKRTLKDATMMIDWAAGLVKSSKGQGAARTNLDNPALTKGQLPTPPNMQGVNSDKRIKQMFAQGKKIDVQMKSLEKSGKTEEDAYKRLAREKGKLAKEIKIRAGAIGILSAQGKTRNAKSKSEDKGGTTYFGADASTFVGNGVAGSVAGSTPGSVPGTTPGSTPGTTTETKAQTKELKELKAAFDKSLSMAGLATGGSKSKFEKEAGSILKKISTLDKDMASSITTNLTSQVANNINEGEGKNLKSELGSLQNIVGKGVTQELSKSLTAEKSKALELAVGVKEPSKEKRTMIESGIDPTAKFLQKHEKAIASYGKALVNPFHAADVLGKANRGEDQGWYDKERKGSKIYSGEEKAIRLGRAGAAAGKQGDIESKTMATLQELTGKDVGDIEYTDIAQFSKEMSSFFKGEKIGKKETRKVLESINLGGNKEGASTQDKFMSRMKRDSKKSATDRVKKDAVAAEKKAKEASAQASSENKVKSESKIKIGKWDDDLKAKEAEGKKKELARLAEFKKEKDRKSGANIVGDDFAKIQEQAQINVNGGYGSKASKLKKRKAKNATSAVPIDWSKLSNDAISRIQGTGGVQALGESGEMSAYGKKIAGSVSKRKGESAGDAFERTAMEQSSTKGNQDWMGSQNSIRKKMLDIQKQKKLYQDQQQKKAQKAGQSFIGDGAGKGSQAMKQSAENEKVASAQAQQEFASEKTRAQKEAAGMDGGDGGGGGAGGSGTIIIKLEGPLEAQIEQSVGLNISLQNV